LHASIVVGALSSARARFATAIHQHGARGPPLPARREGAAEARVRRGRVQHHREHLAEPHEGEPDPGERGEHRERRPRRRHREQPGAGQRDAPRQTGRPVPRRVDEQPRRAAGELRHVEPLEQRAARGREHDADAAVHESPAGHPRERDRPEPGERRAHARGVGDAPDHRLADREEHPQPEAGDDERRTGRDERVPAVAHEQHAPRQQERAGGERDPGVPRERAPPAHHPERDADGRVLPDLREPHRDRRRNRGDAGGRAGEGAPHHDLQVRDGEHHRPTHLGEQRVVRPPRRRAGDAAERARPHHVLRDGEDEGADGREVALLGEHGVGDVLGGEGGHPLVREARRDAVGEDVRLQEARGVVEQRPEHEPQGAEDDEHGAEQRAVQVHGHAFPNQVV
jgi:hypothetical protein